jgi:hypothetical protein
MTIAAVVLILTGIAGRFDRTNAVIAAPMTSRLEWGERLYRPNVVTFEGRQQLIRRRLDGVQLALSSTVIFGGLPQGLCHGHSRWLPLRVTIPAIGPLRDNRSRLL